MESLSLVLDDYELRYLYDIIRIVGDMPYQKSNGMYGKWKDTIMKYYNSVIYGDRHCVVIKGDELKHFINCVHLYGRYRAGRNEGRDKITQQLHDVVYNI